MPVEEYATYKTVQTAGRTFSKSKMLGAAAGLSIAFAAGVTAIEPEMAGAVTANVRDAFNKGYESVALEGSPQMEQPESQLGNVWQDLISDVGRRVALFERGYESPERLPEIVADVKARSISPASP